MEEVLKYVDLIYYQKKSKGLKNGESKEIYKDDNIKIKLIKRGNKIYNIIVNYGEKPIEEIAKS